jgi:hypothetical protein
MRTGGALSLQRAALLCALLLLAAECHATSILPAKRVFESEGGGHLSTDLAGDLLDPSRWTDHDITGTRALLQSTVRVRCTALGNVLAVNRCVVGDTARMVCNVCKHRIW